MVLASGEGAVVIDLDGVVWLGGEALPGVDRAIEMLREHGIQIIFATNNSSPTIETLQTRLERVGIDAAPEEIVSSALAAVSLVPEDSSVLIFADTGVHHAGEERGFRLDPPFDAVIVGWNRSFDFDTITHASQAIRTGARFIATNDDPTHPTPTGLLPGTGAFISAIATAAEQDPVIAGKPGAAMVALVRERSDNVAMVIGDRPSTDGAFAHALGVTFALVRSEATPPSEIVPAIEGATLLDVVTRALGA